MFRYLLIIWVVVIFNICQTFAFAAEEQSLTEPGEHYSKNYNFSADYFTKKIPEWEKYLGKFKGKPNVNYLEIGVFEGRSAIWMLENILMHPTSKLTGIDIFPKGTDWKEKYLSNLSLSGYANKATTIEGASQIELRKLTLNSFDIIYIDGCHSAYCALTDAVLCFDLLKKDGILILDDYLWRKDDYPRELVPKVAIDSFITAYKNYVEVLHRGNQVFLVKLRDPYEYFPISAIGFSPVGQYIYVWKWAEKGQLYRQNLQKPIKLSDKERELIEKLIKSTRFGDTKLYLNSEMANDKDFIKLKEKLKLDFSNIKMTK